MQPTMALIDEIELSMPKPATAGGGVGALRHENSKNTQAHKGGKRRKGGDVYGVRAVRDVKHHGAA